MALEDLFMFCMLLGICGGGRGTFGLAQASGVSVANDLLSKPSSDLIVTMDQPVFPIISSFSQISPSNSREDHVTAMANALQAAAASNQAPVMEALAMLNVHAESYWLTNQIYVKGASPVVIQTLKSFSVVKAIVEEKKIPIMPIINQTIGEAPNGPSWNVKKIAAHKVWKKGSKGSGIVVAGIDTGVKWTHSSIRENYVGNENYGWYDPILYSEEPYDVHGHGTHTTGTMVGNNGIGAAPKAKWMACKGCTIQSCMQHALLACGQYVLCPSQTRNKKLNCTNLPHIVNNSWGGPGGQNWYDNVIRAWRAAGIIPFFAIGNQGPGCATSGHPGDTEDVISVGATDQDDRLAKFSSRGPKITYVSQKGSGFFGQFLSNILKKKQVTEVIKPELTAPGHKIISAGVMTDNAYKVQSGTSMSSPLVAGAAALLLSKNPKLTYDEIKHLLLSTTSRKLLPTDTAQCGDIPETEFPNHLYGYGRLNIYNAYKKMLEMAKSKEEKKAAAKEKRKRQNNKKKKPSDLSQAQAGNWDSFMDEPSKTTNKPPKDGSKTEEDVPTDRKGKKQVESDAKTKDNWMNFSQKGGTKEKANPKEGPEDDDDDDESDDENNSSLESDEGADK